MSTSAKIAITLPRNLLEEMDALVQLKAYPNRSQAIQSAVVREIARRKKTRLAEQCALLVPEEERSLAEEFSKGELDSWPEF